MAVGRAQRRLNGALAIVARTFGELLITVGIVILLFVVYTLYVTDLINAQQQGDANDTLERSWADPVAVRPAPAPPVTPELGTGFTRLFIPHFGVDYNFVVVEGVGQPQLDVGPGHYPGTALPGQPGNVGIAGHRIGTGAPFNDLDKLNSCDAVILETETDFFVYRVMPMSGQLAGWDRIRQRDPRCARVPSLREPGAPGGGPYGRTVGRRIVTPDRVDAVAPVPYRPDNPLPKAEQVALVTLTTCNPEYGNSHRLIIHGVLVRQVPKQQAPDYQALLSRIGISA